MLKDAEQSARNRSKQVEICLLGPLLVRVDGDEIAPLPRKARALLAYLIIRRGVPVPRETIMGLLWGERGNDQARASLRQTLSLIRKALGPVARDLIVADRESVTFSGTGYEIDLENIAQLTDAGDVNALSVAVDNVRGDLLEGLSLPEPTYEQWLVTEREHVRQKVARIRGQLALLLEEEGRIDDAIGQSLNILKSDPTAEQTHRAVMRLYIARGQYEAALKQFKQCRDQLREGLGVEPESETVDLQLQAKAKRKLPGPESDYATLESTEAFKPNGDRNPHRLLMSCTGLPDQPEYADRYAHIISTRGGRIIEDRDGRLLVGFTDPCLALLAAMELRESIKLARGDIDGNLRIGLHATEYSHVGDDPDPRDTSAARALETHAGTGEIDVSEAFFETARRTSPCQFEVLATQDVGRIYRVSSRIARHPFQASYVNDTPNPVKRPYSIAVAPITIAGTDADDQAYLAEGLTEDLILELSRIRKLFVSSRTTLARLRARDPVEIGKALGVKFVLSGSVRRVADELKLSFELSDTEVDRVVWSDRLSSPFTEFLDMIDAVAARVAGVVGGRIEHEGMAGARIKRPENMTAYDHYLRGIWHHRMGGVTAEHSRNAVSWFRKSIEADPNFARPRAALCCAWSDLPDYDHTEAIRIVDEALKSDPADPEVHRICGAVSMHNGDYEAARNHHERAMEMAPNDAYIIGRSACYYSFTGKPERALELLDRAEALDPFLPVYAVEERLVAEYGLGRYEAVLSEASRLPFQSRRSRYYSAAALKALGRDEEGRQLMRDALAADPNLSSQYVIGQETYRDREFLDNFLKSLYQLGLPE